MTGVLYAQAAVRARRLARLARHGPADLLDALRGRRADLVPPRRLDFVGGGGFEGIGQHFLAHFIELGGLEPQEDVLDVGCGIGRMAAPLAGYLEPSARYAGFDIVPEGIRWCRRHVGARRPTFSFELADIHNPRYNPRGTHAPETYTFPYPDASFDFAFATSVFTHLKPSAMDRYMREIARVLRPGGRCLVTFYLLTAEARDRIRDGESRVGFPHAGPDWRSISRTTPEAGIAVEEDLVLAMLERAGLELARPIAHGYWSKRTDDAASHQDIVVAVKAVR